MRIVALLVIAACANGAADTSALDVSETDVSVALGAQHMVEATSERIAIDGATWSSDAPAIATVDGAGGSATITGMSEGNAVITVQLGAARRTINVTVTAAALDRIDVSATATSIPLGATLQLMASGHYTSGATRDITSEVSWQAADGSIASIDAMGKLASHAQGQTQVRAIDGDTTGTLGITVSAAQVASLMLTPGSQSLAKGLTLQLAAMGTLTDGTMMDVTSMVTWMTSDATHATVAAGLVHAVAVGAATIDAAIGDVHGTAAIDVGPAVPDHLTLSTGNIALAQHQRAQLHATLVLTDGTTQDATATATWTSSAPTVASVTAGQIDAQTTASTAMITATSSALSAAITATVGATACHPVINEVQAGSSVSAGDEWVEIYNPCTVAIDVTSWTLVYRAAGTIGATDTNSLQTLTGTLQPGDLRLYAGPAYGLANFDGTKWGGASGLLQASNGGIGLRSGPKDTGPLVDSLTYGTVTAGHPFTESTSASMLANGKSVARGAFDGNDTNTGGADFTLTTTPTPRALNH